MTALTGIDGIGSHANTGVASVMSNGLTVFTVAGGPIRITDLCSYCSQPNDATASTLQWAATGLLAGQTLTNITGVSAALTSFAQGGVVYCNFTTLATAPVITQTTGIYLHGPTASTGGGVVVPAGIISLVIATGPTTGTWQHFIHFVPLGYNVSVTPAF